MRKYSYISNELELFQTISNPKEFKIPFDQYLGAGIYSVRANHLKKRVFVDGLAKVQGDTVLITGIFVKEVAK